VRDGHGRVRGNIYAQHDEPLGLRDCETFDPGWLELLETSCNSKNKSVRLTALTVLNDILQDPGMRHRHSRLALIEGRLSSPSTPVKQGQDTKPSSESEPSKKNLKNKQNSLSSESNSVVNTPVFYRVRNPNSVINQGVTPGFEIRTVTYVLSHKV
jgi:hypothetical protein